MLHAGDLLPLLVALAGDHHDVALARGRDRLRDRGTPVGLDVELGRAADDLADDFQRVFAARVVRRDDGYVRQLLRDTPHDRALLAIAVAPAAEHADEAAGCEVARGIQDVLEGRGLVGVVDEDAERLTLVDLLEPTGNAVDRLDGRSDRILVDAERTGGRSGGERVLD